ncbi:metallophosphoesterase [Helicobacter sp. 11S03491-1]|uniref:UDP-2,3-diacylglucosamine diphosphatase n=1 Tax=Helicobacter sp. 11S03491-1 TaxID=1476196 RepID=UPI000BD1F838|nr:metallophosphoesterase [Helicobacter sp. 11S03491-1]PAF42067.1 hypothetical protein BKH45_05180 [Helicobacter sp. 11S03491-1]
MKNSLSNIPIIKDGALFIADAHYINGDERLPQLLKNLIFSPPPQVFFMGDIFHLLVGHVPSSQKDNQPLLALICELSQKCETFYFEGNHDFGIDSYLLPNVKIYPRTLQPALFTQENKYFLLAHGDIFLSKKYEIYINTLTNPFFLSFLKIIDRLSFGGIYHIFAKKIHKKNISQLKFNHEQFDIFSKKRIQKYTEFAAKNHLHAPYGIIEGHFHIGQNTQRYFSLPSFYCQESSFVIQSYL